MIYYGTLDEPPDRGCAWNGTKDDFRSHGSRPTAQALYISQPRRQSQTGVVPVFGVERMATTALTLLALSAIPASLGAPVATCPGQFTKISAETWLQRANPGWNLGNTLDALPTEGSWNNPPVQPSTFNQVQAAGFKGMRLPVTWNDHFISGSPDWTVDPAWLQRVSDVVDLSISRGFYTIVNVHHDSWNWADVTKPDANYTQIEERFHSLWLQIGTKLGCKSSMLAFEPINEPPGTTQEHGDELNKLNSLFFKAITTAGGFNADRVVTLSGPSQDGAKTIRFFKRPTGITNPWAIQVSECTVSHMV